MLGEFRGWIHRHLNVVCSFMIGMTFGISILVVAVFSNRNEFVARLVRYSVRITGHSDIDEDLIWFFCGLAFGASVACLAWWRDNKAREADLEHADVLHRLHAEPDSKRPRAS